MFTCSAILTRSLLYILVFTRLLFNPTKKLLSVLFRIRAKIPFIFSQCCGVILETNKIKF